MLLQGSLFPTAKPAVGAFSRSHLRNGADGALLCSRPGLAVAQLRLALAGFAELLDIRVYFSLSLFPAGAGGRWRSGVWAQEGGGGTGVFSHFGWASALSGRARCAAVV